MLDVIIVGSGYSGAVIAARLAGRCRVMLVERGKRWETGDFPQTIPSLVRSAMTARNESGLWGMRLGEGTGVGFASAFGGASVVNYGITVQPDDHVFDRWPVSARELLPYFDRARAELGASTNPNADTLGDKQFLDLVEPGRRVDLENSIDWDHCIRCGHCVPGCNVDGAKRSLDRTYLDQAIRRGLELQLETRVESIAPSGGGYALEMRRNGAQGTYLLRAREVVLAAGTLGTLDVLAGARERLPLSSRFGQRMSMNGDGLAFLYNTGHPLSGHTGVPISTAVRIPFVDDGGARRELMVMSGRVPMSAMRMAAAALALAGDVVGARHPVAGEPGALERARRRLRDLVRVDARGALAHSFMYKLDGTDDSRGTARFTPAGAVIDWPDYRDDPLVRFAARRLERWARQVGGTLVPDLAGLPGMRSFGVHPLGGCAMGDSVDTGVVDHAGRVFDPRGGVYPGLRIADASIFPGSLGVPPSLTVATVAERIAEMMIAERARPQRTVEA